MIQIIAKFFGASHGARLGDDPCLKAGRQASLAALFRTSLAQDWGVAGGVSVTAMVRNPEHGFVRGRARSVMHHLLIGIRQA